MIFDVVLLAVSVAVIAAVAWRANRRVEQSIAEMREETQRREAALDKQAKVFVRKLEQSRRAAMKTIDASRAAVDEARSLNANTQGFFQDRRVQRLLDREGGE